MRKFNVKKFLGNLIKETAKAAPVVGGVVKAVETTKNEETESSPKGSINWAKVVGELVAKLAFLTIVLAWVYSQLKNGGLISMDEIKEMLKLLTKYEVFTDLFN